MTKRELATMLAALRNWQEIISPEGGNNPRALSPEHFVDVEPLDADEIDQLCEQLCFGEAEG